MNRIHNSKQVLRAFALGLMILILAPSAFSQVVRDFSAVNLSQGVLLQWTTARETGVTEFNIQRSFDGQRFFTIHTISPLGSNHTYTYTDNDLFKGPQQTFYYRIEISDSQDRVSYSSTEAVSLNFSGIRRTWGSIKAMFR